MKLSILVGLALGTFIVHGSTNATLDSIVAKSNANLQSILDARAASKHPGCTSKNVAVRKDWVKLTSVEKSDYINAVKCMYKKPPITPLSAAPGVRHRVDDFTALHLNQTPIIHGTCIFYTWHREFIWLWEKALREQCGYPGYLPYWDWPLTNTVAAHPLFDGSELSLGGNGKALNLTSYLTFPTPIPTTVALPRGTGGGCIENGPFANLTGNLGPLGPPLRDGLQYNPRCATRDFRDHTIAALTYDAVAAVMVQPDLRTWSDSQNQNHLHAYGHQAIGGTASDTWASPQDLPFYLHHAQLDRLWSIWQGVDQSVRTKQVIDTLTIFNQPPSRNCTLDDFNDFGFLGKPATIGDLSSTIDGPFCYMYA